MKNKFLFFWQPNRKVWIIYFLITRISTGRYWESILNMLNLENLEESHKMSVLHVRCLGMQFVSILLSVSPHALQEWLIMIFQWRGLMQNSEINPSFLRSSFLFNAIWSQVLNNHYNTSELSKIIGLKVLKGGRVLMYVRNWNWH